MTTNEEFNSSALGSSDSPMSDEELRELAKQLRQPEGELGLQTAEMMNETNLAMTLAAFTSLQASSADRVLEIGFGNGDHVGQLLDTVAELRYTGIDISESMVSEARVRNAATIAAGSASFHLGDGLTLPFENDSFEAIFTVNTIYFWEEPQNYLREIARTMTTKARLAIGFITADFLGSLPFTQYGFTAVTNADIETLSAGAGLTVESIDSHTDEVKAKNGEQRTRTFSVATLRKPGA